MKLVDDALAFLEKVVDTQYDGNMRRAAIDLDVTYQTLYSWLGSRTRIPSLKALEPVLEKLHVQFRFPDAQAADYEYVPKVAALAGAGASLATSDTVQGYYAFRKDWMVAQGIRSQHTVLMDVMGDSMEPLLRDGDTLLVDKQDTDVRDGKIYVVTLGEELRVKRVFKGVGGIILRSENKLYPDVPVTLADLETFIVHGRVRWCGKML